MEIAIPGNTQTKDGVVIQQRIEDFFKQDDAGLFCLLSQSSQGSSKNKLQQQQEQKAQNEDSLGSVAFFAKSNQIKGKKGETYQIKEICEHRSVKGVKGFQYKVHWVNHEPTWEPEILIKESADKLLNKYWLTATQSQKEEQQQSALNVMSISQKPLKAGTPQLSQICSQQDNPSSGVITYDEIESAFLANIGNWKKQRRQDNKDIYKCSECDSKLEVEKKGSQFKVKAINSAIQEIHNWFDQAHLAPFNDQNSQQNKSERLHTSVESFIKLQIKNGHAISPDDILDLMKKERPLLFRYFRPTVEQLTYFIVSNNRDLVKEKGSSLKLPSHHSFSNQKDSHPKELFKQDLFTPDIKRLTRRSMLSTTPSEKYPSQLEPKKRENKNKSKKNLQDDKFEKLIASLSEEVDEEEDPKQATVQQSANDQKMKEEPQVAAAALSSSAKKDKKEEQQQDKQEQPVVVTAPSKPSSIRKTTRIQSPKKIDALEQEIKTPTPVQADNIGSKRVKFNSLIEQVEFVKQSEDEESQQNNSQQQVNTSSQESMEDDSEPCENYDNVSSDEEDYESGAFLQFMKQENEKAEKERNFLMKELKVKERRGFIFIDKIKKVVAAVQRAPGKYDYLIEWEYNKKDKTTPSQTVVRGSQFAFSHPLLYRRYVEKHFVEARVEQKESQVQEGLIIKK